METEKIKLEIISRVLEIELEMDLDHVLHEVKKTLELEKLDKE